MSLDRVREALPHSAECSARFLRRHPKEIETLARDEVTALMDEECRCVRSDLTTHEKEDKEREAHWLRHHERIHTQLQELLEAAKGLLDSGGAELVEPKGHAGQGCAVRDLRQIIKNIEEGG